MHNIQEDRGEVELLLLKRIPEKGGFWQPPCGGIEEGDRSLLAGAHREILEETGITEEEIIRVVEEVHSFEIRNNYLTGEAADPIREYVYGFEVKPGVSVRLDGNHCVEHEEFRWVSFESALGMLKWGDNKTAFKKLQMFLSQEKPI